MIDGECVDCGHERRLGDDGRCQQCMSENQKEIPESDVRESSQGTVEQEVTEIWRQE